MSGPYRPNDSALGAIFIGAIIGLIGGATLGKSPLFLITGGLVIFGVMRHIIKGGSDDNESKGQDEVE